MSHTYFVTKDNTATGEQLALVGLSNTNHDDWMTKAGLTRTMQNRETGELEEWLFHTTIHDKEPLCVFSYEFEAYVDQAQEFFGDECPDHMRMLYDFIATVDALESENGVGYKIWLF